MKVKIPISGDVRGVEWTDGAPVYESDNLRDIILKYDFETSR